MLIKTLGLGGAERLVVDVSRSLLDRGHTVIVVYSLASPDTLRVPLESFGATVYRVEASPAGLHALWKILRAERPDVVHAHSPMFKAWARLLHGVLAFRLVTTYHNVFERHGLATRLAETLMHSLDDVRISCSKEVSRSMRWSSLVVPNGIRLEDTRPEVSRSLRERFRLDRDVVVFVCVASLKAKKNHAMLIEAFCDAFDPASDSGPHLVLFGDGELRDELEERVRQAGSLQRIHFAGADPDASAMAREADVFCLVSNYEGLPLALLEAMSNSLPCIATDVGEMGAVVIHGQTGIVVEPGNRPQVADAMRRLEADRNLRDSMGVAGRNRVRLRFGLETMVDRLEEIYLAPPGPGAVGVQ